ncbi:MAG: hypothetical protein IJU76_13115 [Desulfovibrionaceae bacterium]|nr:hypothetical protein [Desulfovibrionaceae bacterium]
MTTPRITRGLSRLDPSPDCQSVGDNLFQCKVCNDLLVKGLGRNPPKASKKEVRKQ